MSLSPPTETAAAHNPLSGDTPHNRISGGEEAILSNVALLYYGEGLTQSEIARRLRVSRATVVNMLRECRERGIVEIRVDGKRLKLSNLSRGLREAYGLSDVYIASDDSKPGEPHSRQSALAHVGRVASIAMLDLVEPGDIVGVAWGETIRAVSEAMPRNRVPDVTIRQMIGSMITDRVPTSESCAIRIANMIEATCYTLHSPAILASASLAETFRSEPTIHQQLDRLKSLDLTVASIGNLDDETHLRASGMASSDEIRRARDTGARGVLCCRFIDADGQHMPLPPDDRIIAAGVDDLKRARKKLHVVCGEDRLEAVRAALAGNLVTHLCVDQRLGERLLSG